MILLIWAAWFLLSMAVACGLAYRRYPLWAWFLGFAAVLISFTLAGSAPRSVVVALWALFLLIFVPMQILPLRRLLFSRPLLARFRLLLPPLSDTEREALEAGTVWWDGELFSGRPDWCRLEHLPSTTLIPAEQAFLDGPVTELCGMLDEWRITGPELDLAPKIWAFLKRHGFFGMIIPQRYGGLEFSARAHSAVLVKLAGRSLTAAVTVMVPNALGPGQLLLRYGTESQKDYYLPRLASGEELPCFALTSALAGSDAAAMRDTGVVCRGEFEGESNVLGIRLNWEKRYITLAPVATLLGLAFKLRDPEHLLGEREDLGITLALIPTSVPGVEVGRRHLVLNQAFQNGPTVGRDVFVPLDYIIGGRDHAGEGWGMLMECLADGRAVSLPALAGGLGQLAVRATGAYARIRRQFKQPIGRFEGVEEALAVIIGNTYAIEAVRQMTVQAIDLGERPAVVSALAKYHCTERMRLVVNAAMDVFGGAAICLGPRNLLGRYYESLPISITVEGANILTRSLIIFGQGLVRCHPFLLKEMTAVRNPDGHQGVRDFDRALFGHLGFTISNFARALILGLSGGRLARTPFLGISKSYAGQIVRFSAALALMADLALVVLGGRLKRQEKLSARLGDVLSQLYIASAALRRFEEQGRPAADQVLLDWVCQDALYRVQEQLAGFMENIPQRLPAWLLMRLIFPTGKRLRPPSDRLGHRLAELFLEPTASRERLTGGLYISTDASDPLGLIEEAFAKAVSAAPAAAKVRAAVKAGRIPSGDELETMAAAQQAEVIGADEAGQLSAAYEAMLAAIAVDDFDLAGERARGAHQW